MRLVDSEPVAGLGLPGGDETGVDLAIQLSGRIVGNVEESYVLPSGRDSGTEQAKHCTKSRTTSHRKHVNLQPGSWMCLDTPPWTSLSRPRLMRSGACGSDASFISLPRIEGDAPERC